MNRLILSALCSCAFIAIPALVPAQNVYPFQDPSSPVSERVSDLVSRMTLAEKVSQMQNHAPAIARLGIPAYDWWSEALHGVARSGYATVFPQAIGMAATWDPMLIGREADVISTEARAKHHESLRRNRGESEPGLDFWSPNINIFRDPRWGRGQETYGEDPFLTSRIGVAFVKGLQGNDPNYVKVISTPKHFAVHSGPEPLRHMFDARTRERDLYETYLPAFEACIREGRAWSIMGAYNR
ncbi:MAG TPA: glycoside hydrolase family 3 N-terminal domain-containing protein, partial [Bacteroidota bacterium]|nr:glycoside hydrolase family 3 N-terminal domain-containing protein [Bacteroidota bacterium]